MAVSRYKVTTNNRRTTTEVNNVTYIQDIYEISVADMNTFSDGDTTPTIVGGKHWKTANTGATTITDFDDTPGDGYHIRVYINDDYTTISHNANIDLPGGTSQTFLTGDVMEFLSVGGVWKGWNSRQD